MHYSQITFINYCQCIIINIFYIREIYGCINKIYPTTCYKNVLKSNELYVYQTNLYGPILLLLTFNHKPKT